MSQSHVSALIQLPQDVSGGPVIAVVIPCFKVRRHILGVLAKITSDVHWIFVVDDGCPENTGKLVTETVTEARVRVLHMPENSGVGGAVMRGYQAAVDAGADVIVKIDGDGQMDPSLVMRFVRPILEGKADYTKGNRFHDVEGVKGMPLIRVVGNAGLSFFAKMSTGYWHLFDPNNGYTAIHAAVVELLPLSRIDPRYFFESDMLFRLNTIQAVVVDVPMQAVYADEISNLDVRKEFVRFFGKHSRNYIKRVFYNYFLRNFSFASVELVVGLVLVLFGIGFGIVEWASSAESGIAATAGTVMLAAMPVIIGIQLLLNFLNYDMTETHHLPVHRLINGRRVTRL